MAALPARPGGSEFDSLLAAARARSASCGADRVRRALLAQLAVGPSARVLELGVGSGRNLFAVAVRAGFAAGVEPDAFALRHAQRRCARLVREGRVALVQGTSRDLSAFGDGSFDKVYGVHVSDFWEEPASHLAEIRRVLRPGGQLLLGSCSFVPGFAAALPAAGFRAVRSRTESGLCWTEAW